MHAVAARSTFRSQECLKLTKSARCGGAKQISKSKAQKTGRYDHFWMFGCRFAWQAQGILHLAKSA